MTWSRIVVIAAVVTVATASVAYAQGRGAAQRPGKVATAQGPKQGGKVAKVPANRPTDRGKPDAAGKPDHTGKPDTTARADKGDNRADRADNEARGTSGERDTIAERIADNPQQRARLEAMLPTGMTLEQAADGFRNQGQFIAALNASKNQGIPFASLKAEMTGPNALSLGQAIDKLRPGSTTTP